MLRAIEKDELRKGFIIKFGYEHTKQIGHGKILQGAGDHRGPHPYGAIDLSRSFMAFSYA